MQGRDYNYRNFDYPQRHNTSMKWKEGAIKKKKKQQTKCVIDFLEDKVDKFSQKVQHKTEMWKTGKKTEGPI